MAFTRIATKGTVAAFGFWRRLTLALLVITAAAAEGLEDGKESGRHELSHVAGRVAPLTVSATESKSRLLLVFVDRCNSVLGFRREFVHGQGNGSVRGGNRRHLCRLGFTC